MPVLNFKKFLHEQMVGLDSSHAADLIKKDCAPFLMAAKGAVFYRGMPLDHAEEICAGLYRSQTNRDRQPKDSPPWLHNAMNDNLIKKCGIALRSCSVFATASVIEASNYGDVHAIFPIGDFNYAWSKLVEDPTHVFFTAVNKEGSIPDELTGLRDQLARAFDQAREKFGLTADSTTSIDQYVHDNKKHLFVSGSPWIEFIQDFIRTHDLWTVNSGLKQAATAQYSGHEIMFDCDSYYVVTLKSLKDVLKKINNS